MTTTLRHITIIALLAMMVCSCNEGHRAKGLVKDFMADNLKEGLEMEDETFSALDSTQRVTPSTVETLRKEARNIPNFKSDVSFSQAPTQTLKYMRVTYRIGEDTTLFHQTFYFDQNVNGIVVCKNY